jgi:hypothetical protein
MGWSNVSISVGRRPESRVVSEASYCHASSGRKRSSQAASIINRSLTTSLQQVIIGGSRLSLTSFPLIGRRIARLE